VEKGEAVVFENGKRVFEMLGAKVARMAGLKVGLYGLLGVERVEGFFMGGGRVGVRWKPGR